MILDIGWSKVIKFRIRTIRTHNRNAPTQKNSAFSYAMNKIIIKQ